MGGTSDEPRSVFSTLPTGELEKNPTQNTMLGLNPRDSNLIGPSHGLRSKSFTFPQVIPIFKQGLEPLL